MAGVNKVILIGNLGRDPEIRHLESGVAVATFSIATTESFKDRNSGERIDKTEWHNIVLWRGLAEVAEKFLHKGDQVYIEGKLRTRSWEKDGVTRYTTEVVADNMTMLTKRNSDNRPPAPTEAPSPVPQAQQAPAQSTGQPGQPTTDSEMDDLPF